MPSRTPSLCRKKGCNAVHRNKNGYCDAHQQDSTGWRRTAKGSSAKRGYGSAWRKVRKQALRRDNGLCVPCSQVGRTTVATEVDHIINKASGGTDDLGNLQSICKACHRAKTATEGRGVQISTAYRP